MEIVKQNEGMFDSDQESEYDAITDPNLFKEQIIF